MIFFGDTETFCETPLKHGLHRYAEDVEITVLAWAVDEGEVEVIDCTLPGWEAKRDRAMEAMFAADEIVFQNSQFDRTVMRHAWGVEIPLDRIVDPMIQAMAHSLPGSLDKLCAILGVSSDDAKDKAGAALIQLFCKPRPKNQIIRRATRETHPVEWQRFLDYAGSDIRAMRKVRQKLPSWNYPANIRERELWQLDQKINDRGIAVDVELAEAAVLATEAAKKTLAARCADLTDGAVQKATQRDQMLAHILAAYGVELPDMRKSTLERRLNDEDIPEPLKELLRVRLMATVTSTAKYKSLMRSVSSDGKLRGTLQFCGAKRTGRWAGRLFQPQNLMRPTMKQKAIDQAIIDLKSGHADLVYDNVMDVTANTIRGVLGAEPDHKLVSSDLSNIEGRCLAWLAGEAWKLDAFRAYDAGEGPDLYIVGAATVLGIDIEDVTADDRQKQGKVPELACMGPDTLVLTDTGVKPIIKVLKTDLVWDGEAWVKHEGLIDRGERRTLWLDGIEMTADHLVQCGGLWRTAKRVASNRICRALSRASGMDSLLSLASSLGLLEEFGASGFDAIAARLNITSTSAISETATAEAAPGAPPRKQALRGKSGSGTQTLCRMTPTGGVSATEYPLASTAATTPTTRTIETTGGGASRSMSPGVQIAQRFSPTWSLLRDGISQLSSWIERTSTAVTSRATSASSPRRPTQGTAGRSAIWKPASASLRPVYDIANAGPRNRFTVVSPNGDALVVHNCGYQGAVGAFQAMARIYGMEMSDKRALEIVKAWRKANPNIVDLWYGLERAAIRAVENPGLRVEHGKLVLQRDGSWLRMKLPSGRLLCYPGVQLVDGKLTYMGENNYTRRWERLTTYGGKLVENATQAMARDVLAWNMREAEDAGFSIALTVHDELVTQTIDSGQFTSERLSAIMSTVPPWAEGLPLAASGWEGARYRK